MGFGGDAAPELLESSLFCSFPPGPPHRSLHREKALRWDWMTDVVLQLLAETTVTQGKGSKPLGGPRKVREWCLAAGCDCKGGGTVRKLETIWSWWARVAWSPECSDCKRLRVKFTELAVLSEPCDQNATQVKNLHLDSLKSNLFFPCPSRLHKTIGFTVPFPNTLVMNALWLDAHHTPIPWLLLSPSPLCLVFFQPVHFLDRYLIDCLYYLILNLTWFMTSSS